MDDLDVQSKREDVRKRSREQAESIVKLAGFEIRHVWELVNGYWPDSPRYDDVRKPWWLFLTDIGPIRLGWRKRVLEIAWDACAFRGRVTADDVTKDDFLVHAWNVEKAVEYMRELRRMTTKAARGAPRDQCTKCGRHRPGTIADPTCVRGGYCEWP